MISISETLIRSIRSPSFDEVPTRPTMLEEMIRSSPTDEDLEEMMLPLHNQSHPAPQQQNKQHRNVAPTDDDSDEEMQMQLVIKPAAKSTKVVKFGVSPRPRAVSRSLPVDQFMKEPVQHRMPFASSLAKEIAETGLLSRRNNFSSEDALVPDSKKNMGKGGGGGGGGNEKGPTLSLKVYPVVGEPPLAVAIVGKCLVQDVIDKILFQYEVSGREPELSDDGSAYELRMLDDDDGSPDMDMPPLDRMRDIQLMNINRVALVQRNAKKGGDDDDDDDENVGELPKKKGHGGGGGGGGEDGRPNRTYSMEFNKINSPDKPAAKKIFLVKVHTEEDNETNVINVPNNSITFEQILPLLSKKKRLAQEMLAKDYKFLSMNGAELEITSTLEEAQGDEFRLARKIPLPKAPKIQEWNPDLHQAAQQTSFNNASRTMTKESALAYSEYSVIKTNSRGRSQHRIMGIDEKFIYNKHAVTPGSKSFDKVRRDNRPITSVISCKQLQAKPQSFQITFSDQGKAEMREYKTETRMECEEIVSKVNFLLDHYRRATLSPKALQS